jgi:hypothetical protein
MLVGFLLLGVGEVVLVVLGISALLASTCLRHLAANIPKVLPLADRKCKIGNNCVGVRST